MTKELKILEENVLTAHRNGSSEVRKVLDTLFPDLDKRISVIYQDLSIEHGDPYHRWAMKNNISNPNVFFEGFNHGFYIGNEKDPVTFEIKVHSMGERYLVPTRK